MNELELMIEQLMLNPDDLVLPVALGHYLEEERGMWATEAEKQVELLVTSARARRDCETAQKMMAESNPVRTYMLDMISEACGRALVENCKVEVLVGDDGPFSMTTREAVHGTGYYIATAVKVGARWLLKVYRENRHRIKNYRKRDPGDL